MRPFFKPRLSLIGYVLGFVFIIWSLSPFAEDQSSSGPLKQVEGVLDGTDTFSFLLFHRTTITIDNNTGESFSLTINAADNILAALQIGARITALVDNKDRVHDLMAKSKHIFSDSSDSRGRSNDMAIAGFLAALSFGWAVTRDRRRKVL